MIFDPRLCELGEGPLWHPIREQMFWFDINNQKLLSQDRDGPREWRFPEIVSAAGWVSDDVLLIAGERDLFLFDLETEEVETLCLLEQDKPKNRPNDGRADPNGGFWIGTMAKDEAIGAGAIYRYYRGELRKLFSGISIPNAICFPPGGGFAHYADTVTQKVMKVRLDAEGWPNGTPEVFLDLASEGHYPDGAVIDANGVMWLAQWGASRVAAYDTQGNFLRAIGVDAPQTTCPAFAGPQLSALVVTSARKNLDAAALQAAPLSGATFVIEGASRGQYEHQVIIG
ncbi:MAG: gluconolactonase [Cypionkella sp.]|uniref:SMP-30/gluconolactonase/LRE family protein n=1 Tax=Cypionkella sp. TaxID=2811411 RepID=UPI0026122DA5|nr:SMP-30/gluconolactonase/LRE family protein [Cypionkella sp.]MDB5657868.1 gluconolactonase [Cypionkella sp.]